MVDGYRSSEAEDHPDERSLEKNLPMNDHSLCKDSVVECVKDSNHERTPTTTISTIALQSGDTRLVIALLQSGESLRLKVLEIFPELTRLGATVDEAKKLSAAHDEVLLRLQSKQSPVEELLRQADQLISTQKPRAEVYAAMAESLGQTWANVNSLLELQKEILDHNVLYQCQVEEFKTYARAVEEACIDTMLPIEIDVVKKFINRIHDLKKLMLNSLMRVLHEGRALLDYLKEIANTGTLDTRPDRIKADANNAVSQVEKWLEELHDERKQVELLFINRKNQLEQCLALALLATDLRDLEEILTDRIAAFKTSSYYLGDSLLNAELLIFELKKRQEEAKNFQDRALKITKATERLVSSKHFAGKQATEQSYEILAIATEYITDLEQYEGLLNRAILFFDLSRSAFTKLDQLEIQLATTEHPLHSLQLVRFHAQTSTLLTEVTASPLAEGYILLDATRRGAPNAEGVRRTVEELKNRKISLLERCTAHKEENLRVSRGLAIFFEKYEELKSWLSKIADAFLQSHQDMGNDLLMARNFHKIHHQLLEDLSKRGDEIDEALAILSGTIIEITDEREQVAQKKSIEDQVDDLRDLWLDCRHAVEVRVNLSILYVEFHEVAAILERHIEEIENNLKKNTACLNEDIINGLEKKWSELQSLYMRLTNYGAKFLTEADRCTDAYLDIPRTGLCVKMALERFANEQLTVTEVWESWQISVKTMKERRIEQEKKIEETTETLAWASKFREQLYPVITSESTKPSVILHDLESTELSILPELKKVVSELKMKIEDIEKYSMEGDQTNDQIKEQLLNVHEDFRTTATDYQNLLESLISIFQDFIQIENKTDEINKIGYNLKNTTTEFLSESGRNDIRSKIEVVKKNQELIADISRSLEPAIDQLISRIKIQEPSSAAQKEIETLNQIKLIFTSWKTSCSETQLELNKRLLFCNFADDLDHIDIDLQYLNKQLTGSNEVEYRFAGDSLLTAEATSSAFIEFEKTVTVLEDRIYKFFEKTKNDFELISPDLVPIVHRELSKLQVRWNQLKSLSQNTQNRISSSIEYFKLLEEAKSWYRDGNQLLIIVAKKSSAIKTPKEVESCLEEIYEFLKPGEEVQDKRIEKIRELSTKIFGTDRLPQFNEVVVENRKTLDSFAVITSELKTLMQNSKNCIDILEEKRQQIESEEKKLEQLNIARIEAEAYEAEVKRKRVEAEMKERENRNHTLKTSVFAQTEEEHTVVETTVTSAIATREIQSLQKNEIEESSVVLTAPIFQVNNQVNEDKEIKVVKELDLSQAPRFIVPLNDSTVEEGNRFILECKLENGKPKPEIVWHKDGISILNNLDYVTHFDEETGICSLMIEETFADDSARFACKAFNTVGVVETGAILTIKKATLDQQLNPPTFIKGLHPLVIEKGSYPFLSCTVIGNPLPTVQWFKNSINIDDSPDYTITYNNGEAVLKCLDLLPEGDAVYTCTATNKLGQTSTTLNSKAQVSTRENEIGVIQSNGISSSPPEPDEESKEITSLQISFIKEHRIIEESHIVKIETHTEEMGGRLSQVKLDTLAQDAEASKTEVVPVKIETLKKSSEMPEYYRIPEFIQPSVQLPLKDVQIFEGKSVRLDCVIIGQPEPEVIWYHDEQPVKESADFQLLFQGDRCSLIIQEAFLDDAGKYKVVAINNKGEASSECVLSVIPISETAKQSTAGSAPQFVKLISDVIVSEDEDTVFECQITGEPKPDLRWYFNNEEIVFMQDRITMTHDELGNCSLKICSITTKDKGNYVAKAKNLYGEAKTIARLVVNSSINDVFKREASTIEENLISPYFEEQFEQKRTAVLGNSTTFECIVHGKPSPKVQWLFNNKPVLGKSFAVSTSGERHIMTISETSQEHVGSISCVAENSVGKATCTAQLEIDGKESQVAAKRVEDVKFDSVPNDSDMQASSSSEKHFVTERTVSPSDQVDESIFTEMSSSITQSSMTKSSCTKEFKSSTTSSIVEPNFILGSGNVLTKSHVESKEYSSQQNGGPPIVQSQKIEEFEKIIRDTPGEVRQERSTIVTEGTTALKMQKPLRKSIPPRFVTPVTGMIVDQGSNVILEGIIDGFPQATITWSKNGQDLKDNVKVTFEHNHVRLELKNVNVKDAGRYTCTAVNEIGNASSTADLVVKKTIFPPVFGKRLQAQVVKNGERVVMEVEITGTPEPTVTWYKDDEPLMDVDGQLKQLGNCYLLVIDAAAKRHAGKYMVHATNAGGEAQSIADFAVFEPTPDTMVEVHKTIVYENVADKNIKLEEKKSELPSAALTAEHIATTTIQPSSTLKTLFPTSSLPTKCSQVRKIEVIEPKSSHCTRESKVEKATRSEIISSTIESHQSETKSEQKFHMKLQHQAPLLFDSETHSVPSEPTITTKTTKISTEEIRSGEEPILSKTTQDMKTTKSDGEQNEENEYVETSTIAKKDALTFFESMSKESESAPRGPKAMIKLTEEDSNYDVKVNKLTKNYERSTTFHETKKVAPDVPAKQTVHDISNKFETTMATKGVDNVIIDFPYEQYKLPALNIQRTVLEDTTASGSPIHGTLTISKLVAQSESAEQMLSGFNLVPEPPPEIGYMPKPEEEVKKRTDISLKAKQIEERQKKTVDAPIGGVKIFPTAPEKRLAPEVKKIETKPVSIPPPFELSETKEYARKEIIEEKCIKRDAHKKEDIKISTYSPVPLSQPKLEQNTEKWWSSTSDLDTRSHISTDLSEYRCQSGASNHFEGRAASPKPSADGLAMEKSWAKSKTTESSRKSWPPPASNKETTKSFTKKEEWKEPEMSLKISTHENRQEVEETPDKGITKTNIESSSSLESRSWSTRESHTEQKVIEKSASLKPIIKSVKDPSPPKQASVTMYKAETTKVDHIVNDIQERSLIEKYLSECEVKKMESSEKFSSYKELKAPGLVKAVPIPKVQLYHSAEEIPKKESENIKSFQESKSMFKGSLATAPKHPTVQLYHQVPKIPNKSEIILEPGPPPEIGYVPPPPVREKKIEKIEKTLEMSLETHPAKIPPGAVRTIPPPIPPKDAQATPPPLPTKKLEPFSSSSSQLYEKTSSLCKYTKNQTIESDCESDFDSCRSKFRSYKIDNEPKYRHVEPPMPRRPQPKSSESESLAPPHFDIPSSEFTGPPRPVVTPNYLLETSSNFQQSSTLIKNDKSSKHHYQSQEFFQEPMLKPGSPPVYVHPNQNFTAKSPPIKCTMPESPKLKVKSFKQESGYMADTDEPFHQPGGISNIYESKQFMENKTCMSSSSSYQKKDESSSFFCHPITQLKPQVQQSFYEKNYTSSTSPANGSKGFKSDKTESCYSWHSQTSSAPSPSRFARGEFRESDYESDYDERISSLWKPLSKSDIEDHQVKSMKSNLAGKSTKSTAVSESKTAIEKNKYKKMTGKKIFHQNEDKNIASLIPKPNFNRQKTVLLPGSPPELAFALPVNADIFYDNAVAAELKKKMMMDESTETSRRIVIVEHTSREMKFKQDQNFNQQSHKSQTHSAQKYKVPTPSKFVQGQFRESDYESDADVGKIRPKWAPAESDTDDPCYKKVQAPKFKFANVSSREELHERVVTPMEFDHLPVMVSKTQSFEHLRKLNEETEKLKKVKRRSCDYRTLPMEKKQGKKRNFESSADIGYRPEDITKAANHVTTEHIKDMTSSFKAKNEKFIQNIQSDLKQQSKPILKHSDKRPQDSFDDPQVYREENRITQYGTKHIDRDTGLIYFKYDFGYEFGIVLPGEGKKTISSDNKTIQGQRRASDIDIPIIHEFTKCQKTGFSQCPWQNYHSNQLTNNQGSKFLSNLKTVKWEPTSESEFSEVEDSSKRKKKGIMLSSQIISISPTSCISKWDLKTPSPISLSPSLPSFSPKHSSATTGLPSNVDSIAETPWPSSNGDSGPKEVIQPYLDIVPKKAPLFITPLRDIAVVSGQTARFECIIHAEPQPNILWSHDGRIIENFANYEVYYRNGVCRLVIFRACPSDAGTYVCTATNNLGSTTTSATLQVPGNRRSMYMNK